MSPVTLFVKGHTVSVVLSLMHVLFLGSKQSTVITKVDGCFPSMVDEPLDLVTLFVKGHTVLVVLSLMHVLHLDNK